MVVAPACGVCGVAALLDGRAFFVGLGVVVVGVIIQSDRLSNNMKLTLRCIYSFLTLSRGGCSYQ